MELEGQLEVIKDELFNSDDVISKIFGKRLLDRIQTYEIKEKLEHFRETEINKISKELDYTVKVLESPVYVGLLGRYSHGKTALVNALFSLEQEYSLPEGEGVVTSKITRVEFDSKLIMPKCFEVYRDNNKSLIEISALKASVGGKNNDDNNSMIDYYTLKMASKEAFARLFEKKKINLIDMPGLGGPYFKDTEKTRKYIENLDMLLIIINASDIDNAGRVIEPYIRALSIPIVPVLTFFDTWKDCLKFTTCTNEEEVIEKAKEEIKEYIPSLIKHETRLIAVSSKTGFQINNLREMVLNFVEEQNFAIEKIKKEGSEVYRRKIQEILKVVGNVIVSTESSLDKLEKNIVSMLPETKEFESVSKFFKPTKEKSLREAKRKINRTTKEISRGFKDKVYEIRYLDDYDKINNAIKKLENDIDRNSMGEVREDISEIFSTIKDNLKIGSEKYLSKLEIDNSKKEELKEEVFDIMDRYDISDIDVKYEPPEIVSERCKDYAKTFVDVIIGNLKSPQFLIPIGAGFILLIISPLISKIPMIGKWPSLILFIMGLCLIGGSTLFNLLLDRSAKKNRFQESKNNIIDKLLASFDRQKIEEDANNGLAETVNNLIEEIEESLAEEISPYAKDIKILRGMSKEFKAHIEKLNKTLACELETLKGNI